MGALEDVPVLLARGLLEVAGVGLGLRDRLVGGTLGLGEQLDGAEADVLVRPFARLPPLPVPRDLGGLDHLLGLVLDVAHDVSPCAGSGSVVAGVTGTSAYSSNSMDSGGFGARSNAALVYRTISGEPHSITR